MWMWQSVITVEEFVTSFACQWPMANGQWLFRPDRKRRPGKDMLLCRLRQRQRTDGVDVATDVYAARTGPIAAEQRLVRDFFQSREPVQQLPRRNAADVQVHIRVPPQQEERGIHHQPAPT